MTSARVVVLVHQATKDGGPVRQPYAGVNYVPHLGTVNLATGVAVIRFPTLAIHVEFFQIPLYGTFLYSGTTVHLSFFLYFWRDELVS